MPQQALYWEVPGFKRAPGRPRANWREDLQRMGLTWEEDEVAALDRLTSMALKCGPVRSYGGGINQSQGKSQGILPVILHYFH